MAKGPEIVAFSPKQRQIMNWWAPESPVNDWNGIIAEGAIRAGKTRPMSLSFVEWAFAYFDNRQFALCGKTIGSLSRNVLYELKPTLEERGYSIIHRRQSDEGNYLEITRGAKSNRFYIFGGRDESSQDLVQGVTLAGVFFDEVALMPESFVNQATGRCSVEGSKYWFNCNPEGPSHWFKLGWVDKAKEKGLLRLQFQMPDNPSLSQDTLNKYLNIYPSGVFYLRYILGKWATAEGAIFPQFDEYNIFDEIPIPLGTFQQATRYIAVDYGTLNPCVFLDIRDCGSTVLVMAEYYWDGRKQHPKTDAEYAQDLTTFAGEEPIKQVIVDPSAASFKTELKNRGWLTKDADNDVRNGIAITGTLINHKAIKVHRSCKNLIREIQGYVWNEKKADKTGMEQPLKKDDHGPDAVRYYCKTVWKRWRLESLCQTISP